MQVGKLSVKVLNVGPSKKKKVRNVEPCAVNGGAATKLMFLL